MTDLVKAKHDVAGGIKSFDIGSLVRIDEEAAVFAPRRLHVRRKLGADVRAERWVKRIERLGAASKAQFYRPLTYTDAIAAFEKTDSRALGLGSVRSRQRGRAIGCGESDVRRIAAQKKRFLQPPLAASKNRDRLVGDFISIADRAIAKQPGGERLVLLLRSEHGGWAVDDAGGQEDRLGAQQTARAFDLETCAPLPQRRRLCGQDLGPVMLGRLWVSGMISDATTQIIAPAAKPSPQGRSGCARETSAAPKSPATGSTRPDASAAPIDARAE